MLHHPQADSATGIHNLSMAHSPLTGSAFVQPIRCLLHRIEAFAIGDPFAEVVLIQPQGGLLAARAYRDVFGELDQLQAFLGREVNLQPGPSGLQLRPIAHQTIAPAPASGEHCDAMVSGGSMALPCRTTQAVQEVAVTVAHLARDLNLPTMVWFHLPR